MTRSPAAPRPRERAGRGLSVLLGARLLETVAAGMLLFAIPLSAGAEGTGSAGAAATLLFAFAATLTATQPVVGLFLSRGLRPLAAARTGFAILGASSAGLAVMDGYGSILALRVVQGGSTALIVPALLVLLASGDPRSRGATLGLQSTLRMAGYGVSPLVAGALMSLTSLHVVYTAVAALCACALLSLHCVPVTALDAKSTGADPNQRVSEARDGAWAGRSTALLVAAAFVTSGCATALAVLSSGYLDELRFAPVELGAASSAMLVSRFPLEWRFGRLADRAPSVLLPGGGMILLACGTLGLAASRSPAGAVLWRAVMGAGAAMFATPALLCATSAGYRAAMAAALISSGFSAGAAAGPLLTGLLACAYGRESALVFWGMLAMFAGAAIAARRYCASARGAANGSGRPALARGGVADGGWSPCEVQPGS